jgi:hypothetical protein
MVDPPFNQSRDLSRHIPRRRFLGLSAALALAGAAVMIDGGDWTGTRRSGSSQDSPRADAVAAIGYSPGSAISFGTEAGALTRLAPASDGGQGDAGLAAEGARIQLWLPDDDVSAWGALQSVRFDVCLNPAGPPFHVWSYEAREVPYRGSPVTFGVPSGMDLLLQLHTAGRSAQMQTTSIRFTSGDEPGVAKLRQGIYVVAFRAPADRPLPAWHRSGLRRASIVKGQETPLTTTGALRTRPHLLMFVDRASRDPDSSV